MTDIVVDPAQTFTIQSGAQYLTRVGFFNSSKVMYRADLTLSATEAAAIKQAIWPTATGSIVHGSGPVSAIIKPTATRPDVPVYVVSLNTVTNTLYVMVDVNITDSLLFYSNMTITFDNAAVAVPDRNGLMLRKEPVLLNNFVFRLTTTLSATARQLSVPTPQAAQIPAYATHELRDTVSTTSGVFFTEKLLRLTLDDGAGNTEIIGVLNYDPATGVADIIRGLEGTTPLSWPVDTLVSCRVTAAVSDSQRGVISAVREHDASRGVHGGSAYASSGSFVIGPVCEDYGYDRTVTVGYGCKPAYYYTTIIGYGCTTGGSRGYSFCAGYNSYAGDWSVAIGQANATSDAVGIGDRVRAKSSSVVVGSSASAGGGCVAIGSSAGSRSGAYASLSNAVLLGYFTRTDGNGSVVIGTRAYGTAASTNSIAIGYKASVQEASSVAIGAYATTPTPYSISFGTSVPVVQKWRTDANTAAQAALATKLTSITANAQAYIGVPKHCGILLDEIILYVYSYTGTPTAAPVITLETQAAAKDNVDNRLATAITAPVTITTTAGSSLTAQEAVERITTGFPTGQMLRGVRATLTTPPTNVTAMELHLIIKGTVHTIF